MNNNRNEPSKGELVLYSQLSAKSGVTKKSIKTMVDSGHVKRIQIAGQYFVHYRDFLRGVWAYDQSRKGAGSPRKDK